MLNHGTVKPGSTLEFPFDSFAGATGASITLTGLAVTDIEVYKNGSMTQRASDAGYSLLDTDGIDLDTITGIHGFSIDLADDTDAGFWQAGARYFVVVSSVTVDGQTVNFVAGTFRIGYPGALLDTTIASVTGQTEFTLAAGPAEDDALNGQVLVLHDKASAVQQAVVVVSDYVGSTKTVTLDAAPTFTIAVGDNVSSLGPATLAVAERAAMADKLLGRNIAGGSDGGRMVKEAFYHLRNRWVIASGTLTVYGTDDATPAWTAVMTGTAGADPLTEMNPA